MKKDNIIWTIEELYKWAVENKFEHYTLFCDEEGCPRNIFINEMIIDHKDETINL